MFDMIKEKFSEYIVEDKEMLQGRQIILKFDNGYGASCINHFGSYGNEIGVLYFDDDGEASLTYNTYITNDVLGHLDVKEAENALNQIKNLPDDLEF